MTDFPSLKKSKTDVCLMSKIPVFRGYSFLTCLGWQLNCTVLLHLFIQVTSILPIGRFCLLKLP